MSQTLEPKWLDMRLTDTSAGGCIQEENGKLRPPTIAELAMAARILPENLQAGVAIIRGRNEVQKIQNLTGWDALPVCCCFVGGVKRRHSCETASLTPGSDCRALYSMVIAELV